MLSLFLLLLERIGLIVTIAFILTRSITFRKLIDHRPDRGTRIKLSILFGLFGIIGTYTGVAVQPQGLGSSIWSSNVANLEFNEAIANSRVIGVVIGGLLGGPVVGLFAGLIAGIHRMLLGGFTGFACAVATVSEGLFAGYVFKRVGNRRLISTSTALFTGFVAETLQMIIILLLAKPVDKAWELVQVIAVPMIVANSIGIAIFIAIIKNIIQEEDRIEADQAQKVLHIVNQTLHYLRKGLNEESSTEIARILLKTTDVSAVSITNHEKILTHVGLGDDHHIAGHGLLTKATRLVLESGISYVAKSREEIDCQGESCPLHAAVIVPLKKSNEVIGVLKFYFSNPKQIRPADKELAIGLGNLLSHQLEVVEAERYAELAKEAEIKALQAQVNPHFLFNSINTIVALIRTKPDIARKLLVQLGNYFRQNLNASLHKFVTIEEELSHTKAYLDIEQMRFSDRLDVVFLVDLTTGHFQIPPLTLQPLVENAIHHGLNGVKKGEVTIKVIEEINGLFVSVMDNGVGMEKDRREGLLYHQVDSEKGTGFGLFNVHQRLIGVFGAAAGLHIESEIGKGTNIWFKLERKEGAV